MKEALGDARIVRLQDLASSLESPDGQDGIKSFDNKTYISPWSVTLPDGEEVTVAHSGIRNVDVAK